MRSEREHEHEAISSARNVITRPVCAHLFGDGGVGGLDGWMGANARAHDMRAENVAAGVGHGDCRARARTLGLRAHQSKALTLKPQKHTYFGTLCARAQKCNLPTYAGKGEGVGMGGWRARKPKTRASEFLKMSIRACFVGTLGCVSLRRRRHREFVSRPCARPHARQCVCLCVRTDLISRHAPL